MDIFKYTNPVNPMKLEEGEFVNELKSIMWVERYRDAGEFTLTAAADSGIREKLPIGTFISHTETQEVMIVENHEISDDRGKQTEIVISGRGFETLLEQRIVGSNKIFPVTTGVTDYVLTAAYSWNQVLAIIGDHIFPELVVRPEDAFEYISVLSDIVGSSSLDERALNRGTLYEAVMALLAIDDLGLKVFRPGPYSPLPGSPNTVLMVHAGIDRSKEVVFSYDTGEVQSADYLWSNKRRKTAALITGRWVETYVATSDANFNRRVMYIDASDIDGDFDVAPVGGDLAAVLALMERRAVDVLASQKDVALTKAETSREDVQSVYRTDYDLGDIVTVLGDYNETSVMRINEYVEILDESGRSAYPTLTMVN